MPRFTLRLFGSPSLDGPDGPVTGRAVHRRRLALLAVLAVARGRPVARERLLGLLWPEQPSDAGRRSLTEAVYVLRRELGEDALRSVGDEVALEPSVVGADVEAFEAAREAGDDEAAVAAYGGPFLDGFYVDDAEDFQRWVDAERDRLAHACAAALERLAAAADREGAAVRAVDWWRRLAAHDPHSARVTLGLARALDAAGDPAAALRVADAHAVRLREELGLPPDGAVTAFAAALRDRPPAAPPAAVAPAPPAPPASIAAPTAPGIETAEEVAAPADGARSGEGRIASSGIGPAERSSEAAEGIATGRSSSPVPAPSVPPDGGGSEGSRGEGRTAVPRVALYGLAVVAALAGLLLARAAIPDDEPAPVDPADYAARRIAVLYFDDFSPGGELAHVAAGLTEMLITELSAGEGLEVISRNGVKPFRDGALPLDSVAAALDVGTVVEGSVRRAGDEARVTVRLVDARTRALLETRTVRRPLAQLPGLEEELAAETATLLRGRLGRELRLRRARAGTRSAPARLAALEAAPLLEDASGLLSVQDSADAARAVRLLQRADSLLAAAERADPAWVHPTVQRAWVAHALARLLPPPERPARRAAGLAHAARALERAPTDARALEVRGALRWLAVTQGAAGDTALAGAEADLRAAAAAEPQLAQAWVRLSQIFRYQGRFAEAESAARRALAEDAWLDQAAAVLYQLLGAAIARGDLAAAREHCEAGRRHRPADWRFTECALTLLREDPASVAADSAWRIVAALERIDPASRARAQGRTYSPLYRRMVAAALSARAGDADRARAEAARARRDAARDPELRLALRYDDAYLRLALGDTAGARAELDAYAAARPALRDYLARDPLFRGVWPAP